MRQLIGTYYKGKSKKAWHIFKQGNLYFLVCDGIMGTFNTLDLAKKFIGVDPLEG